MVFFEGDFITVSIHLPVGNLVLRCRDTLHIQYTIFEPPPPTTTTILYPFQKHLPA